MFSLIAQAESDRRKATLSIYELLVVVVALAVLAGVLLPKLMSSNTKAKEANLRNDLRLLRNAIDAFHADTGCFPATLADLAATEADGVKVAGGGPVTKAFWHGPYVESVPTDAVSGGAFRYIADTGRVFSPTSGSALDGSEYRSW